MKKKSFIFAVATLAMAFCCRPVTNLEKADAASASYVAEYVEGGVTLPLLHMNEGESYQVEIFNADDTAYTTPLEKKSAYVFVADKMGDYLLRYLVNRNGIETYEYASLTIKDTIAPTFTFNHQETYAVGETLALRPQIEDNTAALATVEYQLICNGKMISSAIKNNSITFTEKGEYKLQISVTDGGGNTTKSLYTFTVGDAKAENNSAPQTSASEEEEEGGCGSTVTFGVGGAVLAIAAGAMLMKKKKEDK